MWSQKRLNDFVVIWIKKGMFEKIDIHTIINDFSSEKDRKNHFSQF